MSWEVAVQLSTTDKPLFQQIAIAIATDIERGRLATGTRLTSSRRLALQLGVNRNTVVAAYDELCARGWIAIEATRGAFVIGSRRRPRVSSREPMAARRSATPRYEPRESDGISLHPDGTSLLP
jgi:GntR family transcriptional regulator / MocR family aminotransferase